jgi:oligoendopeptidase F
MTIEHEEKTLTIQQASRFVESPDRSVRKEVYEKIRERRLKDQEKFDEIMNKVIPLRDQISKNA